MQSYRFGATLLALTFVLGLFSGSVIADEFPSSYFFPNKTPQHRAMEGKPAPALTLTNWIGETVTLDDLKGKVVVVDFWATWCGPCVKALPKNVSMYAKYKDQGLEIIGVHDSRRGSERMRKMATDKRITYPMAVDVNSKSTRAWNIRFWPTYFVIDKNGIVRAAAVVPGRVESIVRTLMNEDVGTASAPGQKPPAKRSAPAKPLLIEGIPTTWLEAPINRAPLEQLRKKGTPPAIRSAQWHNTEPMDLADLKGKVVMIDFWGVWCQPCLASIPKVNALQAKYEKQGLVIIGVCDQRNVDRMIDVATQRGITYPVCADSTGSIKTAYRVNGFPDYYFVDRTGKLRAVDVKNNSIEDVIKLLLAEKPTIAAAAGH